MRVNVVRREARAVMRGPKPFLIPERPCIKCGNPHRRPWSYHKRTGWFLPGSCHKCHYKKYCARNKEQRAKTRNVWMQQQRKAGRYASGGRVGTFWAFPPARRLYDKLRRCGVGIEDARSEALTLFRKESGPVRVDQAAKSGRATGNGHTQEDRRDGI